MLSRTGRYWRTTAHAYLQHDRREAVTSKEVRWNAHPGRVSYDPAQPDSALNAALVANTLSAYSILITNGRNDAVSKVNFEHLFCRSYEADRLVCKNVEDFSGIG